MPLILDEAAIGEAIASLVGEIRAVALHGRIAIVGVRSRGDEVAERVSAALKEQEIDHDYGVLDISLYRDDLSHLAENPKLQSSDIPFQVDGAHIVLVDDVLFTGRTIRAALDALTDYGRPARIQLAVLVDRGHREIPIQPDFSGVSLETARMDHVIVQLKKTDGGDAIELVSKQ
ncbi:MAG TPA: bifunctional pyr operon transcriptional regulator/uracil phosphoribosyltransferase PyrR [Verrucomicrobiales bacterium]|nr:bifunctional pyr operon transcriptional regulator/uracil phosphoribosyltransferase PyrR [Verrucomicrobiales bacterium]|tara:strand:- start:584 stop:1108 length:525 start_codon:yes stop_codon:yes gene_type:complete